MKTAQKAFEKQAGRKPEPANRRAIVAGIGLLSLAWWLRRRARKSKPGKAGRPTSVTKLDLPRYLGHWYEIGRLPLKFEPDDGRDITADYTLNKDGSVAVLNKVTVDPSTPLGKTKRQSAKGQAVPVKGHPGRLKVSFLPTGLRWLPGTRANYWVLRIDKDYSTALVGTPNHRNLWLLSREPQISHSTEEDYLETARQQGYDLSAWIKPKQTW